MYVTNTTTTNGYDNITNDYDKIAEKCTNGENNIYIIIPTLLITIPCGLSFLCLMSLMIYTIIKPLIPNK